MPTPGKALRSSTIPPVENPQVADRAVRPCCRGRLVGATVLLAHERPFFAPVAAVVALGVSYAARLRRVGEVVAGVALGVAMGDVFVRLAGTGTWQIALVIVAIMSLAVLVDAGLILATQAGVQAATTLVPSTAAGHWDVAPARQLSFSASSCW